VLFIPSALDWVSLVTGALEELTYPGNFTPYGAVSPETVSAVFGVMFDDFCFNRGACRVIGEIVTMASTTNPDPVRWLPCDGASLLRPDYPDLFAAIGTTYGFVDATHFSLPDLRGRVIVDAGSAPGLTPRSPGDFFGEESHTLVIGEAPTHSHIDAGHNHPEGVAAPTAITIGAGVPAPSSIPAVGITGIGNASLSNSGGGGPHENTQPSLVFTCYIVATE
jgi:microcystin-dependent protein